MGSGPVFDFRHIGQCENHVAGNKLADERRFTAREVPAREGDSHDVPLPMPLETTFHQLSPIRSRGALEKEDIDPPRSLRPQE